MLRTSLTHPLQIAEIPVAKGLLGITFCPGKKGDSVFGAGWDRDLAIDIAALQAWKARHVVTLIEPFEMDLLQVPTLGPAIAAAGIAWHHLPIRDLDVPDETAQQQWQTLSPILHTALDAGENVLVHCRGGLGRAGTIASLILIERGKTADLAIRQVRAVRPGAVETDAQMRWLQAKFEAIDMTQCKVHSDSD